MIAESTIVLCLMIQNYIFSVNKAANYSHVLVCDQRTVKTAILCNNHRRCRLFDRKY